MDYKNINHDQLVNIVGQLEKMIGEQTVFKVHCLVTIEKLHKTIEYLQDSIKTLQSQYNITLNENGSLKQQVAQLENKKNKTVKNK